MKLSEAIKLGSMTGPMIKGNLWDPKGGTGSCALGAAMKAVGQKQDYYLDAWLEKLGWSWVFNTKATCPVCGTNTPSVCGSLLLNNVRNMIPHINNEHDVTR